MKEWCILITVSLDRNFFTLVIMLMFLLILEQAKYTQCGHAKIGDNQLLIQGT